MTNPPNHDTTMKLTWIRHDYDVENIQTHFLVREDKQVATTRWESVHRLVVWDTRRGYEACYWACEYMRGLTEMQETDPDQEPEWYRVKPEQVEVTQYVRI